MERIDIFNKREEYDKLEDLSNRLSGELFYRLEHKRILVRKIEEVVQKLTGLESHSIKEFSPWADNAGLNVFIHGYHMMLTPLGRVRNPSLVAILNTEPFPTDYVRALEILMYYAGVPKNHHLVRELEKNLPSFSYDVAKIKNLVAEHGKMLALKKS